MSPTAERLDRERRGTVLVIAADDLRPQLSDMLTAVGYRVVTIANSTDAVSFLRRQTVLPAMIVLDWGVSGISGLQFIAFHASSPLYSRTPPFEASAIIDIVDRGTRLAGPRDTAEHKLAPGLG